jgi:hypothetical protein
MAAACVWLPTAATWQDFVGDCGLIEEHTAEGDTWAPTHEAAVDAAVELLQALRKAQGRFLVLSSPELAQFAAPAADLRTQPGRAMAAARLLERRELLLGLKVNPSSIGSAVISQPHHKWSLRTREVRGRVTIMEALRASSTD